MLAVVDRVTSRYPRISFLLFLIEQIWCIFHMGYICVSVQNTKIWNCLDHYVDSFNPFLKFPIIPVAYRIISKVPVSRSLNPILMIHSFFSFQVEFWHFWKVFPHFIKNFHCHNYIYNLTNFTFLIHNKQILSSGSNAVVNLHLQVQNYFTLLTLCRTAFDLFMFLTQVIFTGPITRWP